MLSVHVSVIVFTLKTVLPVHVSFLCVALNARALYDKPAKIVATKGIYWYSPFRLPRALLSIWTLCVLLSNQVCAAMGAGDEACG